MNGMREDARCGAFEEDLSAFVDGELDAARERALRAHLATCGACAAAIERLRSVDAALRVLATAPAVGERARLASLGRRLAARREHALRRLRAPRRTPRWLVPFGLGSLAGAVAAATLLVLAEPTALPSPRSTPSAALAAAPRSEAIAAAKARVAAQEGVDAFADRGASAPDEPTAYAAEEGEPIAHLDLVERLAALTPAERAALERDVARWRALSPEARARLRTPAPAE